VEILRLPSLNDDSQLMGLAADWIAPLIDDAAAAS